MLLPHQEFSTRLMEELQMSSKIILSVALAALLPISAIAEQKRIGDWAVSTYDGYNEAFTSNDSGSTFGFLCGTGTCIAYIDVKARCEEGSKIPVLINSSSGSAYVTGKCVHIQDNGQTRYVNSIEDREIAEAMGKGQVIGFAIPMASGQFKVVRFSLNGAESAMSRVAKVTKASSKGYRDTSL